jgi:hypothetical protein
VVASNKSNWAVCLQPWEIPQSGPITTTTGSFDILTCGLGRRHAQTAPQRRQHAKPGPSSEFEEVTAQAGLSFPASGFSLPRTWGDFDNDGDLDIFIPNYQGA